MRSSNAPMTKTKGCALKPTAKPAAKPAARPGRSRCRILSPQVGSLYDILHDHAGLSLFIRPLHWTDIHTKLLGCSFVQLPPIKTPTPPSSISSTPSSSASAPSSSLPPHRVRTPETVVSIGRALDIVTSTVEPVGSKNAAMHSLFATLYPEQFSVARCNAPLDIHFGGYRYLQAVTCQLLWNHREPYSTTTSFDSTTTTRATSQPAHQPSTPTVTKPPNDSPILAYINRSCLDNVRRNGFMVAKGPKGTPNTPVHRLQILRSKKLIPKNLDEDAYFLATIIAMAQKSLDAQMRSGTGIPTDVSVRLVTVSEEEMAFIVYTATVPVALLSMFCEPGTAPTGNSAIKVEYSRVPVWPVLGFKERLGKALGSDIVGDFENVPMDTYENEEITSVPASRSRKRGREALSEVFNASFSEDRGSDYLRPTLRKRRRTGESRIGMVR